MAFQFIYPSSILPRMEPTIVFPSAGTIEHIVVKANGLVSTKGAICRNYSYQNNFHRMWRNNSVDFRSKTSLYCVEMIST